MNRQRVDQQHRADQVQQVEEGEAQHLRHVAIGIGNDHQAAADQSQDIGKVERHASAPSECSKAVKPGKLVATGRMSSMVTPLLDTRPATAKLMAMRWSSFVATGPPPGRGAPPLPSMTMPSSSSSTVTPMARSPAAMVAMRSASLTRSSSSPRTEIGTASCWGRGCADRGEPGG